MIQTNLKQMDLKKIEIKQFINYIITYIITFDDVNSIINEYKTQSEKAIITERILDIIIKFGFCDKFDNYDYIHLTGN